MTGENQDVKQGFLLSFVDGRPRLGWYIAVVSTAGVLLDFLQLLLW